MAHDPIIMANAATDLRFRQLFEPTAAVYCAMSIRYCYWRTGVYRE